MTCVWPVHKLSGNTQGDVECEVHWSCANDLLSSNLRDTMPLKVVSNTCIMSVVCQPCS